MLTIPLRFKDSKFIFCDLNNADEFFKLDVYGMFCKLTIMLNCGVQSTEIQRRISRTLQTHSIIIVSSISPNSLALHYLHRRILLDMLLRNL